MLAISIGLIVAMLVARSSVNAKITELKANTATAITVSPAGIQGGMGSGNLLTNDQLKKIQTATHVASAYGSLTDQLGSSDTNLTSSLTLGSFGRRQMRFESSDSPSTPPMSSLGEGGQQFPRPAMTPHISVTGTTQPTTVTGAGGNALAVTLTSGATINGSSSDLVALVGTDLATKNSLSPGSTFTAYGKTITVKGIYKTKNTFTDSGIVMPLATVQTLAGETGVSMINVTADSSENVASLVTTLKSQLGSAADITSQQAQAQASVDSLKSISTLATTGVVDAAIAGAVIILLMMTIVVRERRREIGVIKAIGGTNFTVATQFVVEALTLTIISGIIGFALGVAVSGGITQALVSNQSATSSNTSSIPAQGGTTRLGRGFGAGGFSSRQVRSAIQSVTRSATPTVFASAIGITLLIAIIGSALPAWLISRVRPAEVLRTE